MKIPSQIKAFYLYGVMASLISLPSFAQLAGTSFAQAKASGKANFYYVYDGVSGFANKNESGNVEGFLVDIMQEFERHLEAQYGIDASSKFYYSKDGDFRVFLNDIKQADGGVFGLTNVSIKEDRKKTYDFSQPYLENASLLISNKNVPTLGDMSQINSTFEGMTAYTLPASTYLERLNTIKKAYFPGMKIEFVTSGDDIIKRLSTDEKSFAFVDINYYLDALNNKLPVKRHAIGDKKGDAYGVIMPKDSDWQPVLDQFLSAYIGTSEYRQAISKHLGESALRLIYSLGQQ